MNYPQLVAACAHTVGADPASVRSLHDALACLIAHSTNNRAYAADTMCRLMAEFIEQGNGTSAKVH